MKFLTEYFNSGSAKQQNKKRLGAMCICITAVLLCLALIVLTAASIVTAVKNQNANGDDGDEGGSGLPTGYVTTALDPTLVSTGNLILIDESHPYATMPEVLAITDRPVKDDGKPTYSAYTDMCFLTADALAAFNKMAADFYAATSDDCLYLTKTEYGTILSLTYYDEATKSNVVSIYDAEAKAPVEVYRWIYQNAAKYGFVCAYATEGTENVFRYVGAEHAAAMDALNADNFPAYLEALKARCNKPNSARSVNVNNVRYKIYYQAVAETVLVPEKNTYTVSGNNVDGYIITEVVSTKK